MIFFVLGAVGAGIGLVASGLWYSAALVFGCTMPDAGQVQGLVLGIACLGQVAAGAVALMCD